MSEITKQAVKKLDVEVQDFSRCGSMEQVVGKSLAQTLKQFCEEEWFAQAIVESDKTLTDCCETILADVCSAISDVETYKRAVEFYVPGSTVKCQMQVVRSWDDARGSAGSGNVVSLLDLL